MVTHVYIFGADDSLYEYQSTLAIKASYKASIWRSSLLHNGGCVSNRKENIYVLMTRSPEYEVWRVRVRKV